MNEYKIEKPKQQMSSFWCKRNSFPKHGIYFLTILLKLCKVASKDHDVVKNHVNEVTTQKKKNYQISL